VKYGRRGARIFIFRLPDLRRAFVQNCVQFDRNKKEMTSDIPAHSISCCGQVIRKNRGQYVVQTNQGILHCSLSSKLHKKLIYPTAAPTSLSHRVQTVDDIDEVDPVAVGDQVELIPSGEGTGQIVAILPRRSKISRLSPGPVPLEQVVVANVDQALIVFAAARPDPKWGMLDRYLVTAETAHLPAIICITKLDLVESQSLEEDLRPYRRIGYPILLTSSATGEGIAECRQLLAGKLSVLIGKSGVGKSSLLNAIQPELGLRVGAVSQGDLGKGRHTTSHLELFPLEGGGAIVDTPGMRTLALWDADMPALDQLFPEMRPHLGQCRFSSCQHENEPNCAVRHAVSAGQISRNRYESYLKLLREL
jgi:ribosome biogenesis GTPase / thiamine phosphate phosphatase